MKVVAEGIETQEQSDFLSRLGCTYGQGFLFSRPMTASNFALFAQANLAQESMPKAVHSLSETNLFFNTEAKNLSAQIKEHRA